MFYSNCGIKILVHRSLIKVNDHDKLLTHDQLRGLRRAITQGLKSQIPANPSKLWSLKVALDAVQQKEVNYGYNCSYFPPFGL